ncbi:MAG: outer membrane protein assembly factor BamD [Gammaproteobacteria bacterium]|nr:outer membrane protein assembly factor BamD [Gammaproteobacteria bacterium]MYF38512.1 outer membrane protein assembly factor BamD [Gammaproteobacteria bacterium]
MKLTKFVPLFTGLFLLVSGCAFFGSGNKQNDASVADEVDSGEQTLYAEAQRYINNRDYKAAIARLELLEAHYPFGRWAEQAQLELIYANFMMTDYDSAINAADRFIGLHPQHQHVDYAYYMKGLSNFQRDRGFFDKLLGTPEPLRDVSSARTAFTQFEALLTSFPDSMYARDAQHRMHYLRNVLAEAELNVAYFYLRRDAWVSAINRAREVIEHYPKSAVVDDALVVLIEANHKLGLKDAADDALEILSLNFPEWKGFNDEGELVIRSAIRNKDRSFINTITLGLLDRPRTTAILKLEVPDSETPRPPKSDES